MNEVFCVMECANGDPDDIMATLVAVYSDMDLAFDFVELVMFDDDNVLLRIERWDVDGSTSNLVKRTEGDNDVLAD